jgi:hypothetical protein
MITSNGKCKNKCNYKANNLKDNGKDSARSHKVKLLKKGKFWLIIFVNSIGRGRIHTIVQKISNWNRAKLSADIFEIGSLLLLCC